ncbi:MAG: homocysteine S-methyltransferase family protein [Clostridia bacterium]|nr:homocysteine S-methyltransferase family protein [Clostridia bacterium]
MNRFLESLGKRILFFDGAMGTMLQKAGLKGGDLPEYLNVERPELIGSIHRAYLAAGCNVVTTNTFGANRNKLGERVSEIVPAAVGIAREAASEYAEAFVAQDIGPTGKILQPFGDLAFEDAYSIFAEQVRAGGDRADLILIETMGDLYETKAAVLAAKENSSLPVVATLIFGSDGRLLTGADAKTAAITLSAFGVDALGVNCGFGPEAMLPVVRQMAEVTDLPIVVNPNAGLPEVVDGKTVYTVEPARFAANMVKIVQAGASCVGGCCGTTPEHIRAEVEACRDLPLVKARRELPTAVTSYSARVEFGSRTVIIGERINPTGKKRLKQALRENDIDYIVNEGIEQTDAAADILDVNVGLPEIDETKMLSEAITELQAVVNVPLQPDTTDPKALEAALRLYNGKAMINSVNGKKETTDAIFPLVQKYGGVTVCLLLDENGIPDSVDGRLAIASKIIERAASFGIPPRELIFDPLAMSVSTDPKAAKTTLETVRRLHESGLKTVLGVSNVSFGLPDRELLTSEFFVLAMQAGLSAGIVNPKSERLMNAYRAFNALYERDEHFNEYISARSRSDAVPSVNKPEKKSLFESILKGLAEESRMQAKALLKEKSAIEIIDGDIVPALDEAGGRFEEKTLFLPQLLMCAEAAKAVFGEIKSAIPKGASASKGTILICTVKNDVHDIGKNIVKTLLENYGYEVVDLGKDVAPEEVARQVKARGVRLVGLSALMTTTVPFMEQTVKAVRAAAPGCKIMVGGAVLTQKYADMIGADSYSKDAMGAVRYAEEVFSGS